MLCFKKNAGSLPLPITINRFRSSLYSHNKYFYLNNRSLPSLTIEQFNSLSKNEKEDVVFNFGIYLLDYENVRHLFTLYQLSTFYVEMVYNLKKKKMLTRIKSHATPDSISKYLLKIDIKELGV